MAYVAIILLFLIILLAGCHSHSAVAPLVGSWKTRVVVDKSGVNIRDSMVFDKNGDWKLFMFQNERL
jgi:hypothetical protein